MGVSISQRKVIEHERSELLERIDNWLDTPMLILGFVWLALLIVELVQGLHPFFEVLAGVIWIAFILEFALKFSLAPKKLPFLKTNWLTVISLLVPALRIFRIARVLLWTRTLRAARGLKLVRTITALNRGTQSLGSMMSRRGLGYVLALTVLVVLTGAGGMLAFEKHINHPAGLHDYATALWWTAMLITTMGTEYWPQTAEGRILCLFLALYGFAMFGYLTASLASFFVDRDAEINPARSGKGLQELHQQISEIRSDLRQLMNKLPRS